MELILKMEEHERRLAKLYEAYASLFPTQEELWLDLAQQELTHALWLQNFAEKEQSGQLSFRKVKINTRAIETSLGYINKQIDLAKEGRVNLLGALAVARDMENALIDQLALEIADTDNPILKALMKKIHLESEIHRNKIADAFLVQRQKQDSD